MTDVQALSCVLTEMGVEYTIISEKSADIFSKINVSKLALSLAKKNCEALSVQERDESLESYYISLVGGKENV